MKKLTVPIALLVCALACSDAKQGKTVAGKGITDTATYMRIGNPDTALAIFMFRECYHYDYPLQRESYIRWEAERGRIHPLIVSLFGTHQEFKQRSLQIDANQVRFLNDARRELAMSADEFNTISDMMEFEYLTGRKDSVLKVLMEGMLADEKVSDDEKSTLKNTLESM